MDTDVVCISDDDEQRPEEDTSKSLKTATTKMRNLGFHYNVYENSYYVPESARIQLELLQKQKELQQQQQQRQQLQQIKDVPKEVVVYVPDDGEEEVLLIGPIRKFARQILFGDELCVPPAEFPYNILLQLEQHLAKSLRNVSFTTETSVWNCTIEQLSCIKISYSRLIDLKADAKFNLIIIRILSQYVNFRSRITAANKSLVQDQIADICREIWFELEAMLSNNFLYIIMVLLRTDAKDYPLDVVLYPLFAKTHELMLRGRHNQQSFPEILRFILTVLFYKHWLLMFTRSEDRKKHVALANISITKYFHKMPEKVEKKYDGFIRRVDDRINHSYLYKRTAYKLFLCKFEVTKAINNFFREYDWFVFVFVDSDVKDEKETVSSRAHSLIAGPTRQRTPINSQSLATHNKQLNQQQQQHQQKAKITTTPVATLVRSSPSPAPSSNSACFSSSLFSSSNISNNNDLSKSSFKNTTITDDNKRLNSTNFKNAIVGGVDDDDSDDIVIIDAHDTESAPSTNRAATINNFDENANFSSATSPLTRSQDDDSGSTRQLPLNRIRLKSSADAQKNVLNFSNFDDSKHASSSSNFHRIFNKNSVSDGELVTESSATLSIDEQRSQAEQSVADTTSVSACIDNGSHVASIDLPTITNKMNGLRCSTDIKVSSSDPVVLEPPIDVDDVDIEPTKSMSVTSSEQPPIKHLKCVPSSVLFESVDVAKEVQPLPTASLPDRPTIALTKTSRTQSRAKSKAIVESKPLIIDDSMSPCSLDDFGVTAELTSKDVPVVGAQRVFNAVPTYDDDAIVLKYRSVSPYFEQEHQKEQHKTSTSKLSICDSHQEKNAPQVTTKMQSTDAVSSSTSATIESELDNQPRRRSRRGYGKRSNSNDQVPTISSNENFVSTALVDSGIASPADEAVSKDTLINVPTSTINDEYLPSTSKSDDIVEMSMKSNDETPTVAAAQTIAPTVTPKDKNDASLNAMSTPMKPVVAKLSDHVASVSDGDQEFKSSPFRIRVKRHKSLLAATSAEVNLNDGYENFLHGLFCDTKTLQKNVSFKTAFAPKRVNGFRVEKRAEPMVSELPAVDVEQDKSTTTATMEIEDISSTTLEKPDEESGTTFIVGAKTVLPADHLEMEIDAHETDPKLTESEEMGEKIAIEETTPRIIAAEPVGASDVSMEENEVETETETIQEGIESSSKQETQVELESKTIQEEIESETQLKSIEIVDKPTEKQQIPGAAVELPKKLTEDVEIAPVSPQREIPETVVEKDIDSQQTADDVVMEVKSIVDVGQMEIPDANINEDFESQAKIDEMEVTSNHSESKLPETNVERAVEQPCEQVVEQKIEQEVESQRKPDEIEAVTISTEEKIPEMAIVEETIESKIDEITEGTISEQQSEPTIIDSTEKLAEMDFADASPQTETEKAIDDEIELRSNIDEEVVVPVSLQEEQKKAVDEEMEPDLIIEFDVASIPQQQEDAEEAIAVDEIETELKIDVEEVVSVSPQQREPEKTIDELESKTVEVETASASLQREESERAIDGEIVSESKISEVVMPSVSLQQEEPEKAIDREIESKSKNEEKVVVSILPQQENPEKAIDVDEIESELKIDEEEMVSVPPQRGEPEKTINEEIETESIDEVEMTSVSLQQEEPERVVDAETESERKVESEVEMASIFVQSKECMKVADGEIESESKIDEVKMQPEEPEKTINEKFGSESKIVEFEAASASLQQEEPEKPNDGEEIESEPKVDEVEMVSVSLQQKESETKIDQEIETTQKLVNKEDEKISAQPQSPEKAIVEVEMETEMEPTTIVIAPESVENSEDQTIISEEQQTTPDEAELDLIDETTFDEIPNGPIEIVECPQAIPSPVDETFTGPLVADLAEINATAEKIRVEFESTKSVAKLDTTIEIDDEMIPETVSVAEESPIFFESITHSASTEKVSEEIDADQDTQTIEEEQKSVPSMEAPASEVAISVVEEKISEKTIENVDEELLVTCSTSEIETKSYDEAEVRDIEESSGDIILMDIVCRTQPSQTTETLVHISEPDVTESNSMPTNEQIQENIVLVDMKTTKATETSIESEVVSEKNAEVNEEQQTFDMAIVESMERMEITCDEQPTSAEIESENEIPRTESAVPAKAVKGAALSVPFQEAEKVRPIETPTPISLYPIRSDRFCVLRRVIPVEPVAIFAAKHFEIQEHAIDFSLKSAEPIEIISTDAEFPAEVIVEKEAEDLQILSESTLAKPIEPVQDVIVASPEEIRIESQPISVEKSLVEPVAISEANSSRNIPVVTIVPTGRDVKSKVEKKSGKSGRRTKPTKMVKVNHLNENTLREICEKTSDNPLIDNLNVLVEVALADQIKNMPGVSVTVKSIQEIDEIANIPPPNVIISPSTASNFSPSKPVTKKQIVPISPPAVEQPALVVQKKDEPVKKRWEKAENGVRKSARIKTKEKKNELFEDTFEDVDRALLKIRKMTEKRKATIFRAVDTIKEISPYKEKPPQPVVVQKRKPKSTETYMQKPVHEETIKSFMLRSNSKARDAKKSKPAAVVEKKKSSPVIEKPSVQAMSPPPPPPPSPLPPPPPIQRVEEKSGPEILTALNLTAKKSSSKRTSSEMDAVVPLPPNDEVQTDAVAQQECKKFKIIDDAIKSDGVELPAEPMTPTNFDEVLRSTDNSSDSSAKTLFTTPTKDIKNRLTNGHSGSSAGAVGGDSSPCAKRALENDENKYMSPLVMKKTFECKCNSDRDRILRRLKEFDKVFQPISSDDNVIGLINETIPNDYMETRTTLIKIKKIFFQRFVNVMQQKYVGIPRYLTQMQQQLIGLSEHVTIDNKIFDDILEWYGNMKDEMRTKNSHTVDSLELFSNFDRFLKWWRRKFKCYCTPIQNKKCSRRFYDTEESISSDSNSQDRNYSPAKGSPQMTKKIDEFAVCASPKLFADFVEASEVDETQHMICQTPSEIAAVQEPIAVVPDSIEAPTASKASTLPSIEPASVPSLPIDAPNTIISFQNLCVSGSTDIEITTAGAVKQSKENKSVERMSPMYEREDSPLMLPPIGQSMDCGTSNFSDKLSQFDLPSENAFDMDMYQEIQIQPLPDVKNDALVSSTPQQLNEMMLQNEIDTYENDNIESIFFDFKREYAHATDPTMGPSKKGYAERPLPVEEAVFTLVDNGLTRISSLSNGHKCAPPKEILDPSRISKKSFAENVAYENHTQSNQMTNCIGNENVFDNSFDYNQDLSDGTGYEYEYIDVLISNTSQYSIENVTNDMSDEAGGNQSMNECVKEQMLDDDVMPIANAEYQHHNTHRQYQPQNHKFDEKASISEKQTAETMDYEQTKMSLEDMIVYDPEETAIEDMEVLKSDYEIKSLLPNTSPVKASLTPPPTPPAMSMPPPKKSTNDDFPFKQPSLVLNGPTAKTQSSKQSSKSHKSKRKHHHDDNEAPSKKQHKSDEVKETTSSLWPSPSSSTPSSHRDNTSSSSSSGGSNSQYQHKKSTNHVPNYIVKNISFVKSQSQSQPLTRSNVTENGDANITRSSHHHNGTDKNSNSDLASPKIINIKIKNLPTEESTKGHSQTVTSSSRRDSKKNYHHSVSSSKLYEEPSTKKSHHSSSRKSSGSSRSLSKTNQHWRAQVNYN